MRDYCHKVRSRMWSRCLMMRAGTPATILLLGTSFTTTALAPMSTLSPTVMPPITLAPQHTSTLSPITGAFRSWSNPIVTCWYILQFLPILSAEMIVEKPCCIIKPPPMSLVVISRVFFPLNHQLDSNLKTPTRL